MKRALAVFLALAAVFAFCNIALAEQVTGFTNFPGDGTYVMPTGEGGTWNSDIRFVGYDPANRVLTVSVPINSVQLQKSFLFSIRQFWFDERIPKWQMANQQKLAGDFDPVAIEKKGDSFFISYRLWNVRADWFSGRYWGIETGKDCIQGREDWFKQNPASAFAFPDERRQMSGQWAFQVSTQKFGPMPPGFQGDAAGDPREFYGCAGTAPCNTPKR